MTPAAIGPASLIQSSFGGNLEAVLAEGNRLVHWWAGSTPDPTTGDPRFSWRRAGTITEAATGPGSIIQSTIGTPGNFEVVALEGQPARSLLQGQQRPEPSVPARRRDHRSRDRAGLHHPEQHRRPRQLRGDRAGGQPADALLQGQQRPEPSVPARRRDHRSRHGAGLHHPEQHRRPRQLRGRRARGAPARALLEGQRRRPPHVPGGRRDHRGGGRARRDRAGPDRQPGEPRGDRCDRQPPRALVEGPGRSRDAVAVRLRADHQRPRARLHREQRLRLQRALRGAGRRVLAVDRALLARQQRHVPVDARGRADRRAGRPAAARRRQAGPADG